MFKINFDLKNWTFFSVAFVLIFGFLAITLGDNAINRDGVGYLMQSSLIANGQPELAKSLFQDLFFAKLLLCIHKTTTINLYGSGMAFNLFCLLGICITFFGILKNINKNKLFIFAGLVVLISSNPLMDKYLSMILRDPGMWFGSLLSLYFLLQFVQKKNLLSFVLSVLSVVIAALFRQESIVFILIPMGYFLFLNLNISFFKKTPISFYIFSASLMIAIVSLILFNLPNDSLIKENYLHIRFMSLFELFSQKLPLSTNHIWLQDHMDEYKNSIKFSILFVIFIQKWISGLGFPHLILAIVGLRSSLIKHNIKIIFFLFLLLSLALVYLNLVATYSISARYFMFNYLVIYIYSAVGLYELFLTKNNLNRIKKIGYYLLIFLLSLQVLDNLIDKKKMNHQKLTANWLLENNIDLNDCYLSDMRIRYYMDNLTLEQKDPIDLALNAEVKYLVLNNTQFNKSGKLNQYIPVKHFPNETSPKVIIYQRVSTDD
jgi:hypothetical protein